MERLLGQIMQKLGDLEKQLGGLTTEVVSIRSIVDEHTGALKVLDKRLEENTAQITALGKDINFVKGQLAKQESKLNNQETLSKEILRAGKTLRRRQNELELEMLDLKESAEEIQ